MTKSPSRSSLLIAAMHHAALAASPNGQLPKEQIMQAIESTVALGKWVMGWWCFEV